MVTTKSPPNVQETVTLRLWTRDEYESLIEHGILGSEDHVELIGGAIVEMTPQKGPHAMAVGFGQDALLRVIGERFHLRVQLPLSLGADSQPEPDLAVIPGRRRDFHSEGHPQTAALIVEVSDTTLAFDRERKGSIYARAGIPEFWILNLQLQLLEVYRDPAPDPAAPFGYAYRQRLSFSPDDRVSPVAIPGAEILIADLLP
ncbi:MAG: Uma2 family endonuclease [Dehalococcoidia bacterium]